MYLTLGSQRRYSSKVKESEESQVKKAYTTASRKQTPYIKQIIAEAQLSESM